MTRRFWIAAVLVVTTACAGATMKVDQSLSVPIDDLAALKTIEVTTQSGEVLARGTFADRQSSEGKIERVASLVSPAGNAPRGSAEIEIDRSGGLSEEEITVKLQELPYPESCRLMADGRELTLFSTPERGKLQFKFTRRVTPPNGKAP
jgi:hypothetical protein